MSARRPTAPHSGGRTAGSGASGTGAVGGGAPRRPDVPRQAAARGAGAHGNAVRGSRAGEARVSASRPASRPGTRPTGSATSSTSRSAAGTERAQSAATHLPRLFSVRAMVLFVVGLLAFVLLFPTVRAYLAQQADNARLAQHVAQARAANEDLAADLERWNDDAYVAAQARERLAFVLPGETAFRVVDPEIVPDPTAPAVLAAGSGPALVADGTTAPWYATIWESVRVAGEADVTAAHLPAGPPTDPTVP